jgi:hypothetical protein
LDNFKKQANKQKETKNPVWHWWLTPVTLVSWEAEIERIVVGGQPGQIVCKIPSPK